MKTTPTITMPVRYHPLNDGWRYKASFRMASGQDNALAIRLPAHEDILTHSSLETATEGEWVHVFLEGADAYWWEVAGRESGVIYLRQPNLERFLMQYLVRES